MKDAVAVLVHGLFSSARTWDLLAGLLEQDPDIEGAFDIKAFEYDTPKWRIRPTRRIPNLSTIAGSLLTFLDVECDGYPIVVLIAHSQGGLATQRYLEHMLLRSQ